MHMVDRHTLHHAQTMHTTSISVRKTVHTVLGITLEQTRPPVIPDPAWVPAWVGSVWSGLRSHYM